MKRIIALVSLAVCLLLTACESRSIGIVGGADGPTSIFVSLKSDADKFFKKNYVNELKLPILDVHIENPFISGDRTLILDDTIENNLEYMVYEYYHSKISGDFSKIKDIIAENESLKIAIDNEEKQFNEGIYFNKIILDEIDVVDKEDVLDISKNNKQKIVSQLKELGMTEFAIVEVEANVKLNEKYLSMGPQISDGDMTRYYLIGTKDNAYKIVEVYWEGFIDD